jgi:ferric hydroxamate transport system permease protein
LAGGAAGWRIPRVVAAAGAGLALGVAGCLVQRLFANPMASPEVLGIGGGVVVGLILVLLTSAEAGAGLQLLGGVAGAAAVAGLVLALGAYRGFSPERLLLVGIAITALVNAATLLFIALGDPRVGQMLAWIGGSTYRMTAGFSLTVLALALAGLALAVPLGRWLDILPLGEDVTRSLGVPSGAARTLVLAVAALTCAAAAMVVGPLSFVGLLAPHFATLAGLRRARVQLLGAAGAGAVLVVFADWVGRVVFAPTELPAGILAVLIGSAAVTVFFVTRSAGTKP